MENKVQIPKTLPLLPVKDAVVFPYMLLSLYVAKKSSKKAIEEALSKSRIVFLSSQKRESQEEAALSTDSVFKVGTAGIILRTRNLKDGRIKVLLQGLSRGLIQSIQAHKTYYEVNIEEVPNQAVATNSAKTVKLMNMVKDTLKTMLALGGPSSPDLLMILNEVQEPGRLADLITGHCELKIHEMQSILETFDPIKRLTRLQRILNKEVEIIRMQNRIKKNGKN